MKNSLVPIIFSGPVSISKSKLVNQLVNSSDYTFVKTITTEETLGECDYFNVTSKEFTEYKNNNELFFSAFHNEHRYGILWSDYSIISPSTHPVMIIPSCAAEELMQILGESIWFFIDADDKLLQNKYTDVDICKSVINQAVEERKHAINATYVLKYNDENKNEVIELICALVNLFHVGGGLSERIIRLMIDCGMLLDNATKACVKGASYDLLLGDEYYYDGKIKTLSDNKSFLTIEPYDYAIVSCKESARIPRDVIGKFGLTVGLFCQGIILSNGPQIDPGFKGTLFCLLFNTSNVPVHLKRGTHYATIEFNKLLEPAPPYQGNYQNKTKIIEYIPANALHGAINELKKEIEKLKKESRITQNIYLAVVGLMFAIISLLLVIK